MSKLFKKLFLSLLFFSLLSFVFVIGILWTYSNKLPDYKFLKNYKPPVSSKLYSDNGELVIDFSTEKRIFVPYNSITKKIIATCSVIVDAPSSLLEKIMLKILL